MNLRNTKVASRSKLFLFLGVSLTLAAIAWYLFTWLQQPTQVAEVSTPAEACTYAFNLPRPSAFPKPSTTPKSSAFPKPSTTPKPTATPPGVCRATFELDHTPVCWLSPRQVQAKYTVHELPKTGGPFYMMTEWYVASPILGPHHYDHSQLIEVGKTYTLTADWPGVKPGEKQNVEIHLGFNVVDRYTNIISPTCSDGLDYYWTPFVKCP